ncbi:hypothetical protein HY483_04500 [Candidatus Woesearchaeota archaeon]|nr:hypothetical protein [Candidatus Woesearchaeota archaeon]
MKIEIDTQRDTKEELQKLAKFLHELTGAEVRTNTGIFDAPTEQTGGLLGIFGDDKNTSSSTTSTLEIAEEQTTEKDKEPELEFY